MSLFGTGTTPEVESGDEESIAQSSEPEGLTPIVSEAKTQHEEFVSHSSDSASESYIEEEERANRFGGKGSTWRSWNENEIQIYGSLRQIWSNDLGATCLWWERETSLKTEGDESFSWHSRRRWHQTKPEGAKRLPSHFSPWPLPPGRVPDIDEHFGPPRDSLRWTLSRKERMTEAKQDIGESLVAHGLRAARKTAKEEIHSNGRRVVQNRSLPIRTTEDFHSEEISDDDETHESIRSYSQTMDNAKPDDTKNLIFSVDDELCTSKLQQFPGAIIQKLDDLLLAMHHSRQGHYAARPRTPSRVQAEEEGDSESDAASEISDQVKARRRKEKIKKRLQRLSGGEPRPRDWSEVLGAAALIRWDFNAVKSTAARCNALLGEDMTFATADEDSGFDEDIPDAQPELLGGVHVDGFMCPIPAPK